MRRKTHGLLALRVGKKLGCSLGFLHWACHSMGDYDPRLSSFTKAFTVEERRHQLGDCVREV